MAAPRNPYATIPPSNPYAPPRTRGKKSFIGKILGFFGGLFRLIFATTLFFAALAFGSYFLISTYIRGEEIPAPDLTTRSVIDALTIMKEHNLSMRIEREEPSDAVTEGHILAQFPKAGSRIKAGSPIRVVVSRGTKHVILPEELAAGGIREAGILLRSLKFKVGNVAYISVPGQPNDTVIACDPPPGVGVPPGAAINFLVASDVPDRPAVLPDLVGLTPDQARDELARYGVDIGEVKVEEKQGAAPGIIHSISPKPGTPLSALSEITVAIQPTPIPVETNVPPPAPIEMPATESPDAPGAPKGEESPKTDDQPTSSSAPEVKLDE